MRCALVVQEMRGRKRIRRFKKEYLRWAREENLSSYILDYERVTNLRSLLTSSLGADTICSYCEWARSGISLDLLRSYFLKIYQNIKQQRIDNAKRRLK